MNDRYICAFRGRRDDYQIPLALAEVDGLEQFITDVYLPVRVHRMIMSAPKPSKVREKLSNRFHHGIPPQRVDCLLGTAILEQVRHRLGFSRTETYARLDAHF